MVGMRHLAAAAAAPVFLGVPALAASLGMDSMVQMLVDSGAKVDVKNKAGKTPLGVARRGVGIGTSVERESTASLLRKLGATQ